MKKNIITIITLISFAVPAICSAAPARPGAYMSGFIGISVPSSEDASTFDSNGSFNDRVEFDPNINIGGTGGYDFGIVRLEGELSYKNADLKTITDQTSGIRYHNVDGNLGALALMVNGFFDLHNDSRVTPYLGGGIGFASLHLSDTFTQASLPIYGAGDATVFAYQAGAGVAIALNQRVSLDIGYRYFGTGRGDFDSDLSTTSMKFESHNAALGVRYKF